jgi:hypothetical protein
VADTRENVFFVSGMDLAWLRQAKRYEEVLLALVRSYDRKRRQAAAMRLMKVDSLENYEAMKRSYRRLINYARQYAVVVDNGFVIRRSCGGSMPFNISRDFAHQYLYEQNMLD